MDFLSFLLLAGIAYLVWRISDQLPDVIFRVSEIQRDVAELRRNLGEQRDDAPTASTPAPTPTTTSAPESPSS